jgi:hypothetical protein
MVSSRRVASSFVQQTISTAPVVFMMSTRRPSPPPPLMVLHLTPPGSYSLPPHECSLGDHRARSSPAHSTVRRSLGAVVGQQPHVHRAAAGCHGHRHRGAAVGSAAPHWGVPLERLRVPHLLQDVSGGQRQPDAPHPPSISISWQEQAGRRKISDRTTDRNCALTASRRCQAASAPAPACWPCRPCRTSRSRYGFCC